MFVGPSCRILQSAVSVIAKRCFGYYQALLPLLRSAVAVVLPPEAPGAQMVVIQLSICISSFYCETFKRDTSVRCVIAGCCNERWVNFPFFLQRQYS